MSYTLDENGTALTETQEGVTMPVDCSFEKVNDWVHGSEVHFEEVQALCLGMATENDRLRKVLQDIRKHQEMIGGSMTKMSATWHMADKALADT